MSEPIGMLERLDTDVRQRPIVIAALLVLLVLLLYGPASHHGFLQWDDNLYVTANPHVTTGFSGQNIAWAFRETGVFYWHPVTWLSHMLDCQLFGIAPGPQHMVNVLLHLLNVLLLFFLLYKGTGAFWRSTLVAALFAAHPLNVETVAWLAERKSLLSALFSLLTIAAYGWYVRRPGAKRYCLVALTFILALMSKPMAVTLPLVLLLLDYWPLRRWSEPVNWRSRTRFFVEKIPLLCLSVASTAITIVGQRSLNAISPLSRVPFGMRLEQALVAYAVYLRKLFWPADLAAFYAYHPHWLSWAEVSGAALLLAGITAVVYRLRRARYLLTGWLLFLIMLLPVSGIVQAGRVVIADRFAYLPAIGIFLAVIWGCGDLVERHSMSRAVPVAVSIIVLGATAFGSGRYVAYWENGVLLFSHAAEVSKAPDSYLEDMIADALVADGKIDAALQHYQRSCKLDPSFDLCHYNIAEILFSRYNIRAALEHYQLAGKYATNRTMVLNCLVNSGEALIDLGEFNAAEQQLTYALSMDPGNGRAHQLLSQIYARRSAQ
ncbi:MAG: tetratricopeptide repeat protein [Acidobacteriaceae bacterium]